ncbi:MAG: sugar phosphate isomerase/epimerase [Eubacteriales bacterium]|jgi:sugar phosphate isomerase/epimerase|nr:sugar phosphate isomerase/epimerase [Eubacteriales bacterium]MDD3572444.1 sugar phosphate isomerase/epimerase [Eubacteriales bacterium]MDD4134768.1 sugar phosphate isomerase/epimerase [Eubacteriales bacterium]NLO13671.1 sugar phosphate isomerase/epimerase [Clostridiales bacterium]
MSRPITLCTAQWADLSLEDTCKIAREMGYDGLEIATWGQVDVHKAASDDNYVKQVKDTLAKYGMGCWALAAHVAGQCVCDNWDVRLDGFAPADLAGKPEAIRAWAKEEMITTARAAKKLGVKVVTGFMGSPIWKYFYSFPQTSEEMIERGFQEVLEVWSPVFDAFDQNGVKFALEVHPSEIAYDYYTTKRLLDTFKWRDTLGLNFDPSHLVWQGMDPVMFLEDFHERVYHVHAKDVAVNLNGRNGVLGSHLPFGDVRRGWNFVSLGHGDVDFDKICRVLNQYKYTGPLSVEWEDSGMDRVYGATEALEYLRQYNFDPSAVAFDAAIKSDQ